MLSKIKCNLIQALEYSKSIQQIRGKTLSDYTQRPIEYFHLEKTLRRFDNVEINSTEELAPWIRISRVERTLPPVMPSICDGFLNNAETDDYKCIPQLADIASICMTIEEANELLMSGIINECDIRPVEGSSVNPNNVDVLIKSSKYEELISEFDDWIENSWKPWAEIEKYKESQINIYRKFFKLEQDMKRTSDIELILGQNLVICKSDSSHKVIRSPLVEYTLDINIDEKNGYSIEINPKDVSPRIISAPFKEADLPNSSRLKEEVRKLISQRTLETDGDITPFDVELTERIAQITAGFLHPQSIFNLDCDTIPEERSYPVYTSIWFIAVRPKSQEPYIENVEALTKQILDAENEENLPRTAIAFGLEPSDEKVHDTQEFGYSISEQKMSALSIDTDHLQETEYFFPLPTNDEQLAILKLLETGDAVSVQGPPGTGKSHTIANIIAHYIATGRRVLVSAKTPEALSGVRQKLPSYLSRLTISLLSTDGEGKKQVEEAVRYLSNEAQGGDLKLILEEKERIKNKIKENATLVQNIESALEKHASNQLSKVNYHGEDLTIAEIVRILLSESDLHSWFPDDLGLEDEYNIKFDQTVIQRIKELRKRLEGYIIYLPETLPSMNDLVDVPSFQSLHVKMCKFNKLTNHLHAGDLLEPSQGVQNIEGILTDLKNMFDIIFKSKSKIANDEQSLALIRSVLNINGSESEQEEILALLNSASEWMEKYKALRVYRINYSSFDWKSNEIAQAASKLAKSKKPFGFISIFKSSYKNELAKIQIRESNPESPEDWQKVSDLLTILECGEKLFAKWNSLAKYFGFFELPGDFDSAFARLLENHGFIDLKDVSVKSWCQTLKDLEMVFPYGIAFEKVQEFGDEFEKIYNSIVNWFMVKELESTLGVKNELMTIAKRADYGIYNELRYSIDMLGTTEVNPDDIGNKYRVIYNEFLQLNLIKADLEELHQLCRIIKDNKAEKWASLLANQPISGYEDQQLCPADWQQSWEYARVRGFINSLPSREQISDLLIQKRDLELQIQKLYARRIELQALISLKKNMTRKISSALARFSAAFSKIGKSIFTVRSRRHLKEAKQAMTDCYDAIPCWIIPESKVEHHIPAQLKAFDLVIIDEASQSDITSLPIILRGEKLLVVGDDKQVSPSFIGIPESKINTLIEECLPKHPLKNAFDPRNSLYDLIGIISPGKRVGLKEHFRCVEAIINYCSKNFYSEPLIPLRLPSTRERLDPPLIDIYVEGGEKVNDINKQEADVIVNEIVKLTDDPAMANRTIGVICLLGFKQALLIDKMILDRIGIDKHERHKILCGDARYFQGQEKDIIFLSMVASPNDARAQTTREDKQKYNVAVSRARDRLVLVRSIKKEQLKNPEDLKLSLIEHFERPIEVTSDTKNLIEKCDSQFERDVFKLLIKDGYRVTPQYKVGNYAIDFVIEGDNDKRLAIELDGDMYHGPDQYAHDRHRQKQLERVGWMFWRCWASDWYRAPEQCYKELLQMLDKMNISPLGSDYIASVYTRFEVRKSNVNKNDYENLTHRLEDACA